MKYLNYFLYLAWNWNPRLAFFVLKHEVRGERKYRQKTIGVNDLKKEIPGETLKHASVYQPVNYYTAEKLFEQTFLEDVSGTLLDLGCGKGRVFGVAAHYGYHHIIGVDISAALCSDAELTADSNRELYPETHFEVINADASVYTIPNSVSTIFLFNPFDATVMRKVLKNLQISLQEMPRSIKILYANPVYKRLFTEAGFVETFHIRKMTYLEGSVLEKE